jgi:hypothetical protein
MHNRQTPGCCCTSYVTAYPVLMKKFKPTVLEQLTGLVAPCSSQDRQHHHSRLPGECTIIQHVQDAYPAHALVQCNRQQTPVQSATVASSCASLTSRAALTM